MKRWLLTYYQATQILHAWGERAWPLNVRFVWKMASRDVDIAIAEVKQEKR